MSRQSPRVPSLGGDILTTGTARLYALLASFGALVLTARWLGPDGRGTLAAAYTAVLLLGTLGYLSLGQVAIHEAVKQDRSGWLAPALGSLIAVTAGVTLIGWTAAGAILVSSAESVSGIPADVLAAGMLLLPFFIWEQYGSCLLMAVGRIDVYNRAQIVGRSAALVGVVGILAAGGGVIGALVALAFGQAVVAGFGLRRLVAEAGAGIRVDRAMTRRLVAGGLRLHPTTVGLLLVSGVDILIVSHYAGPQETAYYQLAAQVLIVAGLLPQAGSLVLYNRLSAQGPTGLWSEQRRLILLMLLAVTIIGPVVAVLAPFGIPLAFGDDYRSSVGMLQGLLIALPGITMASLMASQWIGRGLFWESSSLTILMGVVNIAICLALVPSRGATGAIIATAVSYTVAFVSNAALALWCEREYRAALSGARPMIASSEGIGR